MHSRIEPGARTEAAVTRHIARRRRLSWALLGLAVVLAVAVTVCPASRAVLAVLLVVALALGSRWP